MARRPPSCAVAIAWGGRCGHCAAITLCGRAPSQFVGSELFRSYCVACHGKGGRGDGAIGDLMKKRPPDLTRFSRNNGGVFLSELVKKIIDGRQPVNGHGGKDMPVWGAAFRPMSTIVSNNPGLTARPVTARRVACTSTPNFSPAAFANGAHRGFGGRLESRPRPTCGRWRNARCGQAARRRHNYRLSLTAEDWHLPV